MGISRILGCLLIVCYNFLIHFPLLVDAVTDYYSAANLSSSWNNNGSRDSVVYAGDNSTLRPIFLREGFACGFYCNYDCDGYLFAILIYPKFESPKVVWSANRNTLVRDDATLQLTQDGSLILRDADGALVWSTNTSGKSVTGLNFTETGNLVLFDGNNASVWQSFDHPTDSLVPGQILVFDQKLIASVSNKDWSPGLISFFVTNDSVVARIGSNPPLTYYSLSHTNGGSNTESRYVVFRNGGLFFPSGEPLFNFPSPFSAQYMKLEPKGQLQFYGFVDHMWDVLLSPLGNSDSDYPLICGKYGIFSNQQCICPRPTGKETSYFTPISYEEPDLGCKEITPLSCDASPYQSLLMLRSTVSRLAFKLNMTEIGIESCKQACLSNCSCKAVVFGSSVERDEICYLLPEIFSLTMNNYLKNWTTFIKVQDAPRPVVPQPSSNPVIIISLVSTFGAFMGLVLIIILWRYLFLNRKDSKEDGEDKDLLQVLGMPTRFSHEILAVATENFSRQLGKGGFGSVFEGILTDGTKVAVKCINGLSQTKDSFLAEVETIGRIHHLNLVRLVGYCANKSNRYLIYEYMCNGSLDKWIFHKNKELALDWQTRRKIILDIAKGLSYLHEECRQKIIHLDIKPQNILVDERFNAKVSDFGLSKLIERDQSQVVTTLRGTPGYLAPEWLSSAITEKVDVYSFGIVTLEILCGRRNMDHSQPEEDKHLLSLFKKKAKEDQMLDLVDKYSEDMQLHRAEAVEMMRLAAWCLQNDKARRPSMSMVIKVLEGVIDVEGNLDYNFFNSSGLGETEVVHGRENNVGFASPVLPSILSGPR